jgi:hypothetical protein
MAASRQSDVDMFGYWEAHRKSGSHSTYWWRDMLRALRPPVPRRDSILQDLLRACPSVKEKGSSAKEQEPEFVASVRAYGVMGHELVGNLFCERGTTAVALLSMRMTRASQVRI